MTYYKQHIFVCTNQKAGDKKCCAQSGGGALFDALKSKLVELNLHGPDQVRVSKSGCLGRCDSGPCVVVYPQGQWYTLTSSQDLETIIKSVSDHL